MLTRKSALGTVADGAAPPKVAAGKAAVPASKQVPARVQYVIEDYPAAKPAVSGKDDTPVRMAAADTALRAKDFDGLKGRLTPVSF
jgi:hypothetical protein